MGLEICLLFSKSVPHVSLGTVTGACQLPAGKKKKNKQHEVSTKETETNILSLE